MLHTLKMMCVVALIAGCGDPDDDNALLSASRLSLAERETARVHVRVEAVDDFEYTAPPGITITPVTDPFGPGFDVTPSCDAARSVDTNAVVEVRDRTSDRTAALVVAVTDDVSDACAASVAMWLESCDAASCSDACGPVQSVPPPLVLARDSNARLCVHAEALDSSRPLVKPQVAITPVTTAFVEGTSANGTYAIIVSGRASHWLVGPYQATFVAAVGGIPVSRSVPLDIGAPGDVGLETPSTLVPATEFARVVVPITVHRFLDAIDECAIEVAMPGGCTRPAITNIKLYDATTQGVDACVQLACSGSPHATFTLAYVPAINTPSTYTIPIKVTLPAIDVPQVDIRFAATSRADDLLGCGAGSPRLACADVDGDGALDVVTEGSQGSCIYSVTDWRASLPWTSNAPVPGRILTEARRDVLAIGVSPPALLQLGRFGLTNAWTWTTIWASPPNEDLPADAVLIRSSASGPPDYLVGTRPGGVLRFVSRATGRLLGDVSTGLATDAYAIGVIDVAGGGQDIVLVATMGLAPQGQQIYVFRLDWSTPVDKPPAATQYALGMVMQMPNVPVSQVSITARPRLGYDDDVVVSFYEGPFAAGAAEFTVGLGSLSPLAAMGSVRSIAAASDGSVLYGHESGARRSWIDTMNNNEVVRDVIDPVLDLQPDASYGTTIAPCFDKTATLVGFVVQTGSGSFRISQLGIVPQTP